MKNRDQLMHEQLIDTTRTVRAYAGSDCSKCVIEMLDSLGQSYCMDLVNIQVDGLVALQSAIKQVYAIRNVLANEGMDLPKI